MSYDTNTTDLGRKAPALVDKILKGAKPGDMPVERPTKFDLTVNLKTAKALGLTIPLSLLARADRIVEWRACPSNGRALYGQPSILLARRPCAGSWI